MAVRERCVGVIMILNTVTSDLVSNAKSIQPTKASIKCFL